MNVVHDKRMHLTSTLVTPLAWQAPRQAGLRLNAPAAECSAIHNLRPTVSLHGNTPELEP